jgi:hypothetical protein
MQLLLLDGVPVNESAVAGYVYVRVMLKLWHLT